LENHLQSYDISCTSPSLNPFVRKWREQNRGVLGYLCNVPKEIIYAAGLLPFRLLGDTKPLKEAYAHFPSVFCHYSRSLVDLGIQGDFQHLDGIISINMCDTIVHLANAMQTSLDVPCFYFINRPHDNGVPAAHAFFRQEINKFKQFLETHTGKSITDLSLARSIRAYNQNRSLLKELYALRGEGDTPLLPGIAVNTIAYVSQVMPPDDNIQLLSGIIDDVCKQSKPTASKRPRIHISGSMLQDLSLISLVEKCGGIVVSDDLCSGLRLFWEQVNENGDPLDSLTDYYLNKMPCPAMHSKGIEEQRLADIIRLVRHYRADGVVFCLQKYCDTHQFDLPYLESCLKKEGIPVLNLEVDGAINPEQLRTRLQAFIEILS